MPTLHRETGIALPVTIFVITLLTITLAASFARVDADRAVAGGTEDAVTALALAESGLQTYIGSQSTQPADGDSVRINLAGGYADVVAHVVQKPLNPFHPWLYVIRSTSHVIVAEQGAMHQAVRTVAQFAQWQTGVVRQFAAFVAANDLDDRAPYAITIDGTDFCNDSLPRGSVRTRSASDMNQGNYLPGPAMEIGSSSEVADTVGVTWDLVVNGVFEGDRSSLMTDNLYKSHVIQGDATLNNASGTGVLAVTGNLTTSGALAQWEGVILVGGEIFFNADSTAFLGMVVSGLNAYSGVSGSAPNARIGEEPVYIHYDSCKIRQSISSLTGLAAVRNAWVDNWATY